MKLLCATLGHRPAEPATLNDGLYFTSCTRCGADLIRQRGGSWHAVPPGFHVVWKKEGRHAVAPWQALNFARDPELIKREELYPPPPPGRRATPSE